MNHSPYAPGVIQSIEGRFKGDEDISFLGMVQKADISFF